MEVFDDDIVDSFEGDLTREGSWRYQKRQLSNIEPMVGVKNTVQKGKGRKKKVEK
jgi:hypothetical protein